MGVVPILSLIAVALQEPKPLEPFLALHPIRLALTPRIDGVIESEEWDPLRRNPLTTLQPDPVGQPSTTFMQWEPDVYYFAAQATLDSDIVISLDGQSDGWLVGDDNLEIRIRKGAQVNEASFRRLDATDPDGPVWMPADLPAESLRTSVSDTLGVRTFEVAFTPPRPESPKSGRSIGVRIDAVRSGQDMGPAFLPRPVAKLRLEWDAGAELPSGFSWRPDFLLRSIPAEDSFRGKFKFERESDTVAFDRVEARVEGLAEGDLTRVESPFPVWGRKGGAVFDYVSSVAADAETGYRVLRLTLSGPGGAVSVLRSSFRIAELVDLEIDGSSALNYSDDAQIYRGRLVVRSNGRDRVKGTVSLSAPEEWAVSKGKQADFSIYHSLGVAKVPFEIVVPRATQGTFALKLAATIGERVVTRTVFLPIGQS